MNLSPLLVLTDRRLTGPEHLAKAIRGAVEGGATAFVLREKDLPSEERYRLGATLKAVMGPASLIVASDLHLACRLGARGVQLAAADPWEPVNDGFIVGRSCHDTAELRRAAHTGADYVTLSPIFPTSSKPGVQPLGPDRLAALIAELPEVPPVYALGGIGPGRIRPCLEAGCAGVAVMGAVMKAEDPAGVVRELLEELARGVRLSSGGGWGDGLR
ncbi:MAG: thiamine phosphate synthase [Acidimicrobiia bacterium]